MRSQLLFIAVLLSVTVVASPLNPLNVKTGLWQVTMTSQINTLPKANTSTYKSCVKKEDLSKYPFTDPKANCTWTVVSSTGSQMEANGTCTPRGMGNVEFKINLVAVDSENVRGTGQLNMNGPAGTMSGTYSGSAKWIAAACPADLN